MLTIHAYGVHDCYGTSKMAHDAMTTSTTATTRDLKSN